MAGPKAVGPSRTSTRRGAAASGIEPLKGKTEEVSLFAATVDARTRESA